MSFSSTTGLTTEFALTSLDVSNETLHQPVLIGTGEWMRRIAVDRGWQLAAPSGETLHLCGAAIPLPAKGCLLTQGALLSPQLEAWVRVLDEIATFVASPLLVVGIVDPLRGLAQLARATRGWPYALLIPDELPQMTREMYALTSEAVGMVFESEDAAERFARQSVSPYPELAATTSIKLPLPRLSPPDRPHMGHGAMRVLLVSYFGSDCRAVMVKRLLYWFAELGNLSPVPMEVDMVTAFDQQTSPPRGRGVRHRVPDLWAASLLERSSSLPRWGAAAIANEQYDGSHYITMGTYWAMAMERYFDARNDHYDVVILSGNPFAVFSFAAYAKRRWYSRTVLDYRDPFANNPRMRLRAESLAYNRFVERGFNYTADVVTVVNDTCVDLVEAPPSLRVCVIPNGFDEREVPDVDPKRPDDGLIHFVHAGTFTSPGDIVVRLLDPALHRLHQLGDSPVPPAADGVVVHHGRLDNAGVLKVVGAAHCGLAILSVTGFETPTKVYDYLAMGIDILLVHHGAPQSCALYSSLRDLPGVHWVRHDEHDLRLFLKEYRPSARRLPTQRLQFARSASTRSFAELLVDLSGRETPGR